MIFHENKLVLFKAGSTYKDKESFEGNIRKYAFDLKVNVSDYNKSKRLKMDLVFHKKASFRYATAKPRQSHSKAIRL